MQMQVKARPGTRVGDYNKLTDLVYLGLSHAPLKGAVVTAGFR